MIYYQDIVFCILYDHLYRFFYPFLSNFQVCIFANILLGDDHKGDSERIPAAQILLPT